MPIDNIPFTDRQLLRLARSKTTDPVPTATVCYVWDAQAAGRDDARQRLHPAHPLHRARSRATTGSNEWVAEKRDVGADFLKLFSDESTTVPPIIGVAVGADSDNTQEPQRRRTSAASSLEP